MNDEWFDEWREYLDGGSDTKKLLRFGTDDPRCAKCGTNDYRLLCNVPRGKRTIILCRNCKALRKPRSAKAESRKAKRLADAGYFEPTCVVCYEPTLQVLEIDHLSGIANSDVTEPLCANHHAIKSYMAETGPMAVLRLRDPERSALLLQAAFEFGIGSILGMFAIWDGAHGETARCIFLGVSSGILIAWALWNVSADSHFETILGPGYDRAIPASVPR
jgi:hypothetical protein